VYIELEDGRVMESICMRMSLECICISISVAAYSIVKWCLSVYLSICVSVYLSLCLSVCLSISMSISISLSLSVCLSSYPPLSLPAHRTYNPPPLPSVHALSQACALSLNIFRARKQKRAYYKSNQKETLGVSRRKRQQQQLLLKQPR